MHKKIKLIGLIVCFLICVSFAYAIPQPNQPNDPFSSIQTLSITGGSDNLDLDISPSSLSIMGSSCSNLYSTTGEYCSGHVRIYYQCFETLDGGQWQQRSENCEDYSGRCVEEDGKAKCVDGYGQTPYGKKLLWIGVSLIFIGLLICVLSLIGVIHPFFIFLGALLVYLGSTMLIKFIVGGV